MHRCVWIMVLWAMGCQPPSEPGCPGQDLLVAQAGDEVMGPSPVGVRTVSRYGLDVEIWYPAEPGSEVGQTPVQYDLRRYLVAEERAKISDDENPWQACPCFRDLPMDERRGPYPVVVFVHGTAAFRHQSAQTTAHWASHGFVVVAMDHPGIYLADMLQLNIGPQQDQDARELLADLRAFRGGLSWLSGHVDLQRIALAGHSAGGYALESLGDEAGVKMLIPMAAAGTLGPAPKVYSLIMGALDDQVVPWARAETGYEETPGAKMLVGLKNAGHLAYSDICAIGRARGGLIHLLQEKEINLPEAAGDTLTRLGTDGCALEQMTPWRGWTLINHITTSQLKVHLQCRGTGLDAPALRTAYDSELLVSVP